MRRIIALLLTVVMALSLVVVAGAAETGKTVNLRIEPAMTDEVAKDKTELTYYVYLEPQGDAEVGAAQFTLTAPEGTTFKSVDFNTEYVYNDAQDTPVVGSAKGIFAKDAITNVKGGDLGGHFENGGMTFKAVLAGTVRKAANGMERRILTANTSTEKEYTNAWLYEVKLKVEPAFDGKTNYTIGVKDATAGYNGDSNETGSVNDLTMRHTVNVSSKGYGGILGDVDMSGEVDIFDALFAYDIAMNKRIPTDAQRLAANVDGDDQVTIFDALTIYRKAMNLISNF